jgi:hypothetical protein
VVIGWSFPVWYLPVHVTDDEKSVITSLLAYLPAIGGECGRSEKEPFLGSGRVDGLARSIYGHLFFTCQKKTQKNKPPTIVCLSGTKILNYDGIHSFFFMINRTIGFFRRPSNDIP